MAQIASFFSFTTDSQQGGRPYMEDVICVQQTVTCNLPDSYSGPPCSYFAVFDGHGGHSAAEFVRDNLLGEITSHPGFWSDDDALVLKAITDGFLSTHKLTWNALDSWPKTSTGRPSNAGTTASVVFLRGNKLYVGHVGDSTVVLGAKIQPDVNEVVSHSLTKDHKPELEEERERIESSGGLVEVKAGIPRVVWKRPKQHTGPRRRSTHVDNVPFLAIARSLGDLWSYSAENDTYHVSPVPDVTVRELDPTLHKFVILASDGLWNVVNADESVKVVSHIMNRKPTDGNRRASPAAVLVRLALDRWAMKRSRADNTSVIVVNLFSDDSEAILEQLDSSILDITPTVDTALSPYNGATPTIRTPLSPYNKSTSTTGTPVSPLRASNSSVSLFSPDVRPRFHSLPLNKAFGASSFTCCRPIFKQYGENLSVESTNRRRTLAGTRVTRNERKLFKIPVTPEQRIAYGTKRPGWKGLT